MDLWTWLKPAVESGSMVAPESVVGPGLVAEPECVVKSGYVVKPGLVVELEMHVRPGRCPTVSAMKTYHQGVCYSQTKDEL